jgi:hypothetical protein
MLVMSIFLAIQDRVKWYNVGSFNNVSPNDISPINVLPNDISPNNVLPNDVSPNEVGLLCK